MSVAKTRVLRIEMVLMLAMTLILASARRGQAQDASSSHTSSSMDSADSSQSSDTPDTARQPAAPAARLDSPLADVAGKVLVGEIMLRSVELDEVWNQANIVNAIPIANGSTPPTLSTGLSAEITYDRQFRNTLVAFQYTPNVYFVDHQVFKDIDNQNTNVNLQFHFRPRLFITIQNKFQYNGAQNLAVGQYFTTDLVSQTVTQNSFLNVAGYYLNYVASVRFEYFLSARMKLSLSPGYTYSRTAISPSSAASTSLPAVLSDHDAGATIGLDYQLSSTRGIGAYYSFDRASFNQFYGTSYFDTVGVRYSQLIRPTLSFAASVGASSAFSNVNPLATTVVGNVSLIKLFTNAQLIGAYSRGYGSAGGFISAGYSDRVDVGYSRQMTKSWTAGAAGAFLRGNSVSEFTGSYVSVNTGFRLTRTISWFVLYGLDREVGVQTPFYPGVQQFASTGLRWNASGIRIGTGPHQ